MDHEALRRRFRPEKTTLLLIGESPPAGPTCFYRGDSNLFMAVRNVITRLDPAWPTESASFLDRFVHCGYYLEDLSVVPLNHKSGTIRRKLRKAAVPDLARRLQALRPAAILCVLKAIEVDVRSAIELARPGDPYFAALPFPSFGWQGRFEGELESHLRHLRETGVLRKCRAGGGVGR